jgi:AAA domain
MSEDWAWAGLVNWQHLFSGAPDAEICWLAEPFIEVGTAISIYGDVKAGKSLLAQDIAARKATGQPCLATEAQPPMHVLYLDWENNQELLRERYRDKMGYTWEQLPYLHYASYPEIPPMDTPEGGRVACHLAWACQAQLVFIDTTSRVIAGAENSADTFADVYKYTLLPMKRARITTVRLDHEGKDASRGQRGTSAKGADVDVVWHLIEERQDRLLLNPDYDRGRHAAPFRVVRCDEPLRHEMVTADLTPAQAAIASALAQMGVPADAGREACREALKTRGLGARNQDLAAVIRWRKAGGVAGNPDPANAPDFAQASAAASEWEQARAHHRKRNS